MAFRRQALQSPTKTLSPDEALAYLNSHGLPSADAGKDEVVLHWQDEAGDIVRTRGNKDSILGDLDRLSGYLAKYYPWSKDQATRFVLCGEVQQVATIRGAPREIINAGPDAHKFDRTTIGLEVESWVPPDLVRKAYIALQRQANGGRRTRRGEDRNVAVFRFVVRHAEIQLVSEAEYLGKLVLTASWRRLLELWNDQYKGHDWRYKEGRVQNFQRDFIRGQEAIIGSERGKWGIRGLPGQPMTANEVKRAIPRIIDKLDKLPEDAFEHLGGDP